MQILQRAIWLTSGGTPAGNRDRLVTERIFRDLFKVPVPVRGRVLLFLRVGGPQREVLGVAVSFCRLPGRTLCGEQRGDRGASTGLGQLESDRLVEGPSLGW